MTDDSVCIVCRTHLATELLVVCDECGCWVCPACGTHGQVAAFGVMDVPPSHTASVRASVWGRAN